MKELILVLITGVISGGLSIQLLNLFWYRKKDKKSLEGQQISNDKLLLESLEKAKNLYQEQIEKCYTLLNTIIDVRGDNNRLKEEVAKWKKMYDKAKEEMKEKDFEIEKLKINIRRYETQNK